VPLLVYRLDGEDDVRVTGRLVGVDVEDPELFTSSEPARNLIPGRPSGFVARGRLSPTLRIRSPLESVKEGGARGMRPPRAPQPWDPSGGEIPQAREPVWHNSRSQATSRARRTAPARPRSPAPSLPLPYIEGFGTTGFLARALTTGLLSTGARSTFT
jgi:hypothetical protein